MKPFSRLFTGAFILFISCVPAGAAGHYPEIRVLSRDDALFIQQQAALDEFRRLTESRISSPSPAPAPDIFEYRKRKSDDLFGVNARVGLRYDTLATLNGAANMDSFNRKGSILIPSQDGLYVNDPPRGDLESIVLSTRIANGITPQKLRIVRDGAQFTVYYFPAEAFTGLERAYFLRIIYATPIAKGQITSFYGWRSDPFTGNRAFHGGIDIGAPEGTPVHAAREGTVEEAGKNATLGNFVVITHPGGYQTVYGHLSAINVTIKERVSVGTEIGTVGKTGHATGPHLHFEVRTRKGTTDPMGLIRVKKN